MYKEITFDFDNQNNFYSVIAGSSSLIKLASNLSIEITDFIKDHKFDTKKYVYVLINALGAEEYYGPNKNGDGFPEYYEGKKNLINDGREYGYKTFQYNAKLYKHHVNKDPAKSYGDVLLAIYNNGMHRVELIVRMDREKAPEECRKAESGEIVSTSMGTKVPYDVCSICGNKAKTREDYCCHLKESLNHILPDGRKIYAINPFPKFFDISLVFVPADVTSRVLIKIAQDKSAKESIADQKEAEIEKEIPGGDAQAVTIEDLVDLLLHKKTMLLNNRDPEIPTEVINGMCKHPLNNILSTLGFVGIMPKPKEFQRIVLIKMNKPDIANMLDRQNIVFDQDRYDIDPDVIKGSFNISQDNISSDILNMIESFIPKRSLMQPFLLDRLIGHNKIANDNIEQTADNLLPIMLAVAGLYALFRSQVSQNIVEQLATEVVQHPMIAGTAAYLMMPKPSSGLVSGDHIVSTGTLNPSDLLKISSYMDGFIIKKAGLGDLIGKALTGVGGFASDLGSSLLRGTNPLTNVPKYLEAFGGEAKNVATEGGKGLYSTLGRLSKNWGGFLPGETDNFERNMVRRAFWGAPIAMFGSGIAQQNHALGKEEGFVGSNLRRHPAAIWALTALGGHHIPMAIRGEWRKFASIDPLLNPDSDTVKLLFKSGTLIDVATLIQLGKLS